MIRVLHLITTLQPGGAQTMLANLVSGTDPRSSIQHVVIGMLDGAVGDRIRRHGVPVHTLGMERGRVNAHALVRFLRLLRREKPSIVQTWLYHADLLGLLAIPVLRVPVVWNIRSAWHQGIKNAVPRLCARLSRLPAAIVVNSHAGQAVHRELGYRPRRWRLIGNGFDLDVFRPDDAARAALRAELGLTADTMLVGLIGRWDPHKDHATFLTAAARLPRQFSGVHFILAGEGLTSDNAALRTLISDLQLTKCVHLLGPRDDIPSVTAALDVASCTSVAEAFPNVVGEAMAAGVPCVATDVGDAATLVGDSALVVAARDPQALTAAWARLLSIDGEARRRLGMVARERIQANYSRHAVVQQYEKLYRDLLVGCER